GTVNALGMRQGFTFDTGGGSTQVVAVAARRPVETYSVQAGVVRFTERYVRNDNEPINKTDIRILRDAARSAFTNLDWLRADPAHTLAGMGGTIRTLARIDQKSRAYPLDRVHGYSLSREALAAMVEQLSRKGRREREQIPGMKDDRADVTLAGAVIIEQLMDKGGFRQLTVSGQGVREGFFYAHFLQGTDPPLFADSRSFSMLNLARLSHYEEAHCQKVAALSLSLFDQLVTLHGYGPWERELLGFAATIHDIGVSVGYYDHHKHSEYLVHNAALLGFSHREIVILGALVRNHRKGLAELAPYTAVLQLDDGVRIARLSALLRLAEYLERSKSQVVQTVRVTLGETVRVIVEASGDASVEIWDTNRRAGLFRKAFDKEIEIVAG
ncbi:MAG: Ppx/GppA family phosphatase, partial [Chloroflexales bacterium]